MSNPAGRHFLQIPGPSNVPDRVLRAYWNWEAMLKANQTGNFPYTPATNLLYALRESLKMLLDAQVPFNKGGVDAALDYLANNP